MPVYVWTKPKPAHILAVENEKQFSTFGIMPPRSFWEIVKDDEKCTFEIINESSVDDDWLNELICKMQTAGLKVRCETVFHKDCPTRAGIVSGFAQMGYREEIGLWERLNGKLQIAGREKVTHQSDRS